MNLLDLIIIIILFGALIRGYQLGLIRTLISFSAFFIAIFVAYRFSGTLSPYLQQYIPLPTFENSTLYMLSQSFQLHQMFYNAIAFFIIFIGIKIILSIGGGILHQIANLPGLKLINRSFGAIIGLAQATLIIIISIHFVKVMPWDKINNYVEGSIISNLLLDYTPVLTEFLYGLWNSNML